MKNEWGIYMKNLWKKRIQAGLIAGLTLGGTSLHANAMFDFDDVPVSNQFYEPITWASSAGLIKGYDNAMFKPKNYLTEAHFALMFTRFIEPNAFAKNPQKSERDVAYDVLKKHGIVLTGHTNKKAQNATFTRLQVAKSFYTYVEKKSASDKQAIDWMYKYNISKGKGISSDKYIDFGGNDKLKREHMAQFFKNLYTEWYFEKNVLKTSFSENDLFKENTILKNPLIIDFNGDGIDELLITYDTFKEDPAIIDALFGYRYFGLYSYNNQTDKWEHQSGDFLFTVGNDNGAEQEVVSITGDPTEQLMMYFGAYRNLTVATITATDLNNLKVSSSDLFAHEYPSWNYVNNHLVIQSSNSYSGLYTIDNGLLTKKSLTQLPKIEEAPNTLNIQYAINNRGEVTSNYYSGETIYVEVGQTLDFDQGKYDWYEKSARIMYSGDDVFGDTMETSNLFVRPGVIEIQILPLEDWDKALTLNINVGY